MLELEWRHWVTCVPGTIGAVALGKPVGCENGLTNAEHQLMYDLSICNAEELEIVSIYLDCWLNVDSIKYTGILAC